jgi:hypothetical protein
VEKFADWKAPWEKSGTEFDAEKARKYVYDLTRDKETLTTEKAAVVQERDALKTKVEEAETKDLSEVERLKRELEKAKESKKEDPKLALENARLKLALDHGLTVAQAKRLHGSTPEELEADVPELLETLGNKKVDEKEKDAPKGRFSTGNQNRDGDKQPDPVLDADENKRAELFD